MKKIIIYILVVLLCGLIGCNIKQNNMNNIIVTDMEGTDVCIPKDIKRVACISQSVTDLMIAFGVGDKIVGTYRSFTYNPWVREIYPLSKNYKAYSYSVSVEELLADEIDLVIIQDTENIEAIRKAGIPVIAVHQYSSRGSFEKDVYAVANLLGDIFGGKVKERADKWKKDVKDTIEDIKKCIGDNNTEEIVYYVNGEKAKGLFYSDGGNSMISFILKTANMRLATEKYNVLNVHNVQEEEMLLLNPYAMLIGGVYQNKLIDSLYNSKIWSSLSCSKENRIYRIPVVMVGIENVSAETPVMLKYIANMFNEEYKFNIYESLKDNVKYYFGYDLSNEDIDKMCQGLSRSGDKIDESK